MSTTPRSSGHSHNITKITSISLLGLLIVINYATAIDYAAYRKDTIPHGTIPQSARTTREILEQINLRVSTSLPTLQDATEHFLHYGAFLRMQILDIFGELVYDHYDDFGMTQIEALYRIYRETLERKYNIFDIVPSILDDPDTRPRKICSHINEHISTCLKESSNICMNVKIHDEPREDAISILALNITRRFYHLGKIKRNYPNGFSLKAVLYHLRAGRLIFTSSLFSGLLHNIQYDNFDDKLRNAERELVTFLGSSLGKSISMKPDEAKINDRTMNHLLKKYLENGEKLFPGKMANHAAYLSRHVVREVTAVSENIELLGTVYENSTINLKYLFELILPNDTVDLDIVEARDYLLDRVVKENIIENHLSVEKYQQAGPDQLLMEILGQLKDIHFAENLVTSLYAHARFWHKSHMIENLNELLELFDAYENLRGIDEFSGLVGTLDRIKNNLRDSRNLTIELSCTRPRDCLRIGLEIVANCAIVNDETKRAIRLFIDRTSCGCSCLMEDSSFTNHNGTSEMLRESEEIESTTILSWTSNKNVGQIVNDVTNDENPDENDVTLMDTITESFNEITSSVTVTPPNSANYDVKIEMPKTESSEEKVMSTGEDDNENSASIFSQEPMELTMNENDQCIGNNCKIRCEGDDCNGAASLENCVGRQCIDNSEKTSESHEMTIENCHGANCEINKSKANCTDPDCLEDSGESIVDCEGLDCEENSGQIDCEGDDCSVSNCEDENCSENSKSSDECEDCEENSTTVNPCDASDCSKNLQTETSLIEKTECRGSDCPVKNCTGQECGDNEIKVCRDNDCADSPIVKNCEGNDCQQTGTENCEGPDCPIEGGIKCRGNDCSGKSVKFDCDGKDCPENICKGPDCQNNSTVKCQGLDCPKINCTDNNCPVNEGFHECEGSDCSESLSLNSTSPTECKGFNCPIDESEKSCEGSDCSVSTFEGEGTCEGSNCPDSSKAQSDCTDGDCWESNNQEKEEEEEDDCEDSGCTTDENEIETECAGENCPERPVESDCNGSACSIDEEKIKEDCVGQGCPEIQRELSKEIESNCEGPDCPINKEEIREDCEGENCKKKKEENDCEGTDCPKEKVETDCIGSDCLIDEGGTKEDCKGADCKKENGEKDCEGPDCLPYQEAVSLCKGENCSDTREICIGENCITNPPPTTEEIKQSEGSTTLSSSTPIAIFCDNSDPHYQRKLHRLRKMRLIDALSSTPRSSYEIFNSFFQSPADIKTKTPDKPHLKTKILKKTSSRKANTKKESVKTNREKATLKKNNRDKNPVLQVLGSVGTPSRRSASTIKEIEREIEKHDASNFYEIENVMRNSSNRTKLKKHRRNVWNDLSIEKFGNSPNNGASILSDTMGEKELKDFDGRNARKVMTKMEIYEDDDENAESAEDSSVGETTPHQGSINAAKGESRMPEIYDTMEHKIATSGGKMRKWIIRVPPKKKKKRRHPKLRSLQTDGLSAEGNMTKNTIYNEADEDANDEDSSFGETTPHQGSINAARSESRIPEIYDTTERKIATSGGKMRKWIIKVPPKKKKKRRHPKLRSLQTDGSSAEGNMMKNIIYNEADEDENDEASNLAETTPHQGSINAAKRASRMPEIYDTMERKIATSGGKMRKWIIKVPPKKKKKRRHPKLRSLQTDGSSAEGNMTKNIIDNDADEDENDEDSSLGETAPHQGSINAAKSESLMPEISETMERKIATSGGKMRKWIIKVPPKKKKKHRHPKLRSLQTDGSSAEGNMMKNIIYNDADEDENDEDSNLAETTPHQGSINAAKSESLMPEISETKKQVSPESEDRTGTWIIEALRRKKKTDRHPWLKSFPPESDAGSSLKEIIYHQGSINAAKSESLMPEISETMERKIATSGGKMRKWIIKVPPKKKKKHRHPKLRSLQTDGSSAEGNMTKNTIYNEADEDENDEDSNFAETTPHQGSINAEKSESRMPEIYDTMERKVATSGGKMRKWIIRVPPKKKKKHRHPKLRSLQTDGSSAEGNMTRNTIYNEADEDENDEDSNLAETTPHQGSINAEKSESRMPEIYDTMERKVATSGGKMRKWIIRVPPKKKKKHRHPKLRSLQTDGSSAEGNMTKNTIYNEADEDENDEDSNLAETTPHQGSINAEKSESRMPEIYDTMERKVATSGGKMRKWIIRVPPKKKKKHRHPKLRSLQTDGSSAEGNMTKNTIYNEADEDENDEDSNLAETTPHQRSINAAKSESLMPEISETKKQVSPESEDRTGTWIIEALRRKKKPDRHPWLKSFPPESDADSSLEEIIYDQGSINAAKSESLMPEISETMERKIATSGGKMRKWIIKVPPKKKKKHRHPKLRSLQTDGSSAEGNMTKNTIYNEADEDENDEDSNLAETTPHQGSITAEKSESRMPEIYDTMERKVATSGGKMRKWIIRVPPKKKKKHRHPKLRSLQTDGSSAEGNMTKNTIYNEADEDENDEDSNLAETTPHQRSINAAKSESLMREISETKKQVSPESEDRTGTWIIEALRRKKKPDRHPWLKSFPPESDADSSLEEIIYDQGSINAAKSESLMPEISETMERKIATSGGKMRKWIIKVPPKKKKKHRHPKLRSLQTDGSSAEGNMTKNTIYNEADEDENDEDSNLAETTPHQGSINAEKSESRMPEIYDTMERKVATSGGKMRKWIIRVPPKKKKKHRHPKLRSLQTDGSSAEGNMTKNTIYNEADEDENDEDSNLAETTPHQRSINAAKSESLMPEISETKKQVSPESEDRTGTWIIEALRRKKKPDRHPWLKSFPPESDADSSLEEIIYHRGSVTAAS